ncbi:glycosyltransferase family 4 protein [bacterium]|nr:glycosyltransferase family 4 protein [bacterium]
MTARHILFVTDAWAPETGGVERVCRELARALVAADRRVTLIARAVAGRPLEETIDGVRVRRYKPATRVTPIVYASHRKQAFLLAQRIIAEDRPDIAHIHLTLSGVGPAAALSAAGIPYVAGFYGPWAKEFRAEVEDRLAQRNVRSLYFRAQMSAQGRMQRGLLAGAAMVVALSDFSLNELAELCPEAVPRAVKIPGGIDPALFHFAPADEVRKRYGVGRKQPLVVTARRLVRRTGVDLFIETIGKLREGGMPTRAIVAGDGPERKALEYHAVRANVANHISFLGAVDDATLADLYRVCDVFVMPTRAQENFGLPVIEAAACGAIVVCTPVGSLPEVMAIVGSPHIAGEASAESLAATLRNVLPNLRENTVAKRQSASDDLGHRYAWERIAERYMEIYDQVAP